eukprot:4584876-Pyramimonas_sp.AAC.1
MPKRGAEAERSAASWGEVSSGLPQRGIEQRGEPTRGRRMSAGGWGATGARFAKCEQQLAVEASRQGAGPAGAEGNEVVVCVAGQGLARQRVAGRGEHRGGAEVASGCPLPGVKGRVEGAGVLVVARVRGLREYFVTACRDDGAWELLPLRVPPKNQTPEERVVHARRQATYQDDEQGNYVPGMRVHWARWEPYLEGEDLEWVKAMARGGAPMLFSEQPALYWRQRGNYTSYYDPPGKG